MGDVEGVREALSVSGEAAVNHTVEHGVTPLMLAARVGAKPCRTSPSSMQLTIKDTNE